MSLIRHFLAVTTLAIALGTQPIETAEALGTAVPTATSAWCGHFSGSTQTTIIYGQSTIVGGGVRSNGDPVSGATMDLWARPYAKDWRRVGSATTYPTGNASTTHTPRFNTLYQWRFGGNAEFAASTSNYVTVRVSTKLTMHVADSSLRSGQSVVAYGRSYPAKPGLVVTLWRKLPSFSTKLATTRVRSDGTYRLSARVSGPARYWGIYTTIEAGKGNAKGTSSLRQVSIG